MARSTSRPSIQFCIRREDGTLVPLLAADELPLSVELHDVPRQITAEQALENGIKLVSKESPRAAVSGALSAPAPMSYSTTTNHDSSGPLDTHAAVKRERPVMSNEIEEYRRVLRRGTKIWCSKWLDTRDCAFQQQGCRYRHDIPPRELWKDLGFPQGRPWWQPSGMRDNIERTLALVRSTPPISDAASNSSSQASAARPRVPATDETARNSPAVGAGLPVKPESNAKVSTSLAMELDEPNLIDFGDDDSPDHIASDTEMPAQKKLKIDAEAHDSKAGLPASPSPAVRAFVPAGESVAKHVSEARARTIRRRENQLARNRRER